MRLLVVGTRWRPAMDAPQPLEAAVTVDTSAEAAFVRFTAGLGGWWPPEFSRSQPALLERIGMECREGGLLWETGPHGFRIDRGRVVVWEPPRRPASLWQIGADRAPEPDPERASLVTVTVEAASSGAAVTVVHDWWERHGTGAQAYRDGFAGAWPMALERLAAAVSEGAGR